MGGWRVRRLYRFNEQDADTQSGREGGKVAQGDRDKLDLQFPYNCFQVAYNYTHLVFIIVSYVLIGCKLLPSSR